MNDPGIEGLIQCELQEASDIDIYKILIDEENKSNALTRNEAIIKWYLNWYSDHWNDILIKKKNPQLLLL